jgi:gamma-glutamylcyclotransferase (GGCT)/AIG2-like uncharacterized protein YtfP
MDWNQIRERCPSARFVCIAKLLNHRLAFTRKSEHWACGVADAVPQEATDVWGVVYQIEETDTGRLDRSEGYSPGRAHNCYCREERRVLADGEPGKPMNTWVYFAEKESNPPLPNSRYKGLIVEGGKFWHLPKEYLEKLETIEVAP